MTCTTHTVFGERVIGRGSVGLFSSSKRNIKMLVACPCLQKKNSRRRLRELVNWHGRKAIDLPRACCSFQALLHTSSLSSFGVFVLQSRHSRLAAQKQGRLVRSKLRVERSSNINIILYYMRSRKVKSKGNPQLSCSGGAISHRSCIYSTR
jgi:hypothetical protein